MDNNNAIGNHMRDLYRYVSMKERAHKWADVVLAKQYLRSYSGGYEDRLGYSLSEGERVLAKNDLDGYPVIFRYGIVSMPEGISPSEYFDGMRQYCHGDYDCTGELFTMFLHYRPLGEGRYSYVHQLEYDY